MYIPPIASRPMLGIYLYEEPAHGDSQVKSPWESNPPSRRWLQELPEPLRLRLDGQRQLLELELEDHALLPEAEAEELNQKQQQQQQVESGSGQGPGYRPPLLQQLSLRRRSKSRHCRCRPPLLLPSPNLWHSVTAGFFSPRRGLAAGCLD